MLIRLLVLAIIAVSIVPPAVNAEPENSAAADGSSLRGAPQIEILAEGLPNRETVVEPAPVQSSTSGLAMSTLAGIGNGSNTDGAACTSGKKQRWIEILLHKAMQWFSEPDCAEIVAPDLHLLRNSDGEGRPFRLYEHEEADRYLESFLKYNASAFRLGYKRAGRYLPMIRRIFMEEGLPEALIYLPAVESNFNPYARSPARAMGLWQFMVATARRFDLRVRYPWYDERLDPEKATRAAARLLVYLHNRYNDWELALAAYNAGEGRVNQAIREARAKGRNSQYWNLRLPPQTRAYVPALLAMVKLYRSPAQHGFSEIEAEAPVKTEVLHIRQASSMAEVAHRLKMPLRQLVKLNPAWRRGYIPVGLGGQIMLRLPAGRKDDLLASLEKEKLTSLPWLTHTVERRETLSKIARGYGVAMSEIVSVNPISNRHFLSIGQKLIIPLEPYAGGSGLRIHDPSRKNGPRQSGPSAARPQLHKVSEGETLGSISRRYRVSEQDLRRWNSDLQLPLRPSRSMVVFLPPSRKQESVAIKVPSS